MNDSRTMLANFMLCKKAPVPKTHWLHIVAIEDEEQRYVTKILGTEDSLFFSEDCFARIAKPSGYEYIWEREHGKKPLMFHGDLSEIENIPKSQRNIKDYKEQIDHYTSFINGTFFEEERPVNKEHWQEKEDSQQAQSDKSSAEYQLWRKQKGLSYDESEMLRCWQSYCAYRKKYGLKPVRLESKA